MNFMEKLSTGQVSIQDGEILEHEPASLAEEWVGEFQQEQVGSVV